jgi:UDP-N-acetyl-D-mannosaminuronate dehydrogenase
MVSTCDVVIISTAHPAVDYAQLAQWAQVIVDTRNAIASIPLSDRAKV